MKNNKINKYNIYKIKYYFNIFKNKNQIIQFY